MLSASGLGSADGRPLQLTIADLSVDALGRLSPYEHEEPPELLVGFDVGAPDLVPEPAALLAAAQAWIADPDVAFLERVNFLFCRRGPSSRSGHRAEEAPTRAAFVSAKAAPQQRGANGGGESGPALPAEKPKKPTMAGLAAQLETLCSTLPAISSKLAEADQKQQELATLVTAGAAAPLKQPLGSAATLGAGSKAAGPLTLAIGPPPPTRHPPPGPPGRAAEEAADLEEAIEEAGRGDHLARAMLAQSQALTSLVQQLAAAGGDGSLEPGAVGSLGIRGSAQRARLQEDLAQGPRHLLSTGVFQHEPTDDAVAAAGSHADRTCGTGGVALPVLGKIRRMVGLQRLRPPGLSGGAHLRCPAARPDRLGEGPSGTLGRVPRASCHGRRANGSGLSDDFLRGPPLVHVHGSGRPVRTEPCICTTSFAEVGVGDPHSPSGARHHTGQARRADEVQSCPDSGHRQRECRTSAPAPTTKEKATRGPMRHSGCHALPSQRTPASYETALRDEAAKSFSTTTTFGDWAAALPRWLLRSHTPFSAYLARTFQQPASRCGSAPATATFPLPCPRLGLFGKGSQTLPRAQKQRLYLRRVVHIVVAALNFVHDGGRWAPWHLFWREPNATQLACFKRIRAFVVACFSRKEEFPLPPGRSGPDLVARLLELEAFAGAFVELGSSSAADLLANVGSVPGVPPSADLPQLQPYRSLDVSRLRLHGTGSWQIAPFLEGSLWLPFVEPGILRHGLPLGTDDLPDFEKEDAEEHLKLALLWDTKGLLQLVPPLPPNDAFRRSCRIFNSYKSPEADRQIGDRRPANRAELHLTGPSRLLPQGSLLTAYRLPRRRAQLTAFVTDRRDFYHQVAVTQARANCNRLPFAYPAKAFEGTAALAAAEAGAHAHRNGAATRPGLLVSPTYVPAFLSLLQGDHLGVEFALEGHSQLLAAHGALQPAARVLGSSVLPLGSTWQALVIDDLVNLCAVPVGSDPAGPSEARALHVSASQAYESHQILGSPDKDVLGSTLFQAVGAEVDSRGPQVSRACVPVASPLARRVALSTLSLRAARLPITSAKLLSRLTGAWVSCAMFRRCSMCIFQRVFGPESRGRPEEPLQEPVPQPRKLAQELCLASALMPLMASNIAVHQHGRAYATDASLALGAYCETEVGEELSHSLWLNGDRRGAYSRLSVGATSLLRALGEECSEDQLGPPPGLEPVPPSLPFVLDLLEIGHPAGPIAAAASELGLRVGPPIHVSSSQHYAIEDPDFFVWLYAVLKEGRVLGLALHPPVGPLSFCSRSLGLSPLSAGDRLGHTTAARILLFFRCALRFGRPALLLVPAASALLEWPSWKRTAATPPAWSHRACLCAFGGRAGRRAQLLGTGLPRQSFQADCCCERCPPARAPCPHGHLPPGLVKSAARAFRAARCASAESDCARPALESVVSNDLLCSGTWKVRRIIRWKGSHHINVLELSSLVVLLRELAREAPDSRFCVLLDSAVAKAAAAKGRSTSYALAPGLARACAIQLAFGLYMSLGFAPTRLNVADDPTRRVQLRPQALSSLCQWLPTWALHGLGARRFTRPLASWSRLFLLVLSSWGPPSSLICSALGGSAEPRPSGGCLRDFDATLGYPGEGPVPSNLNVTESLPPLLPGPFLEGALEHAWLFFVPLALTWARATSPVPFSCTDLGFTTTWISLASLLLWTSLSFDSTLGFPGEGWSLFRVLLGIWGVGSLVAAMAPPAPRTPADARRAETRAPLVLFADRVVRPSTRANRAKLLEEFDAWLRQAGYASLKAMLIWPLDRTEEISATIVEYGRTLFRTGAAYYRYSETINAVAAARPGIRRHLGSAWDLAFAWLAEEPHAHHRALPKGVLLALLTAALTWYAGASKSSKEDLVYLHRGVAPTLTSPRSAQGARPGCYS